MELKLTKEELTKLNNNEDAIKLNLISRVLYNESLNEEFDAEELKVIWFQEQNNILELYMRTKVEPRVMVNETTVLDEYNARKAFFEQNNIKFPEAREIIRENLIRQVNEGLFEDLVKKIMNDMEEKITLSKEDILFTKGNPELIKSVLLITALNENAKKDNFFEENKEEIELLKKDARLNYYLDKKIRSQISLTNDDVLEEVQRVSKENFESVKNYSQDQLFKMIGDQMYVQTVQNIRNEIFNKIVEEHKIDDIVKELLANNE